jgi:arsenate reductase (thioredoxin)
MKKKVLFLCTGNSCRSQIAEALVNSRLGGEWKASSAGSRPAGFIHPKTIQVLAEIGIQHNGRSKSMDEFHRKHFDLVVTVCDDAAENCPVWLGKEKQVHHSFPDPAKSEGTDAEMMQVFRRVRDDIEREIIQFLAHYN